MEYTPLSRDPSPESSKDDLIEWPLECIGFDEQEREQIMGEISLLGHLASMTEQDIRDMATSLSRRKDEDDGRVRIGQHRLQQLIGLMHWAQDLRRCGRSIAYDTDTSEAEFHELIDTANDRARIRKAKIHNDTITGATDPGKFTDDTKWHEWSQALLTN